MMTCPKPDQAVRVHYRPSLAAIMPHEGKVGVVELVAKGPGPRNHGVRIESELIVVPAGNLYKTESP